jgi:hypothetical protein
MVYRFVVRVEGKPRNFLTLQETNNGDIILLQRGKFHAGQFNDFSGKNKIEESTNITVHPSLLSTSGIITINYKRMPGSNIAQKIAYVLDVKNGDKLFPVYTSIGRDLTTPSCDLPETRAKKSHLVDLWPDVELDIEQDSLAFMLLVANPQSQLLIPDSFPRNSLIIHFKHLQVVVFYWKFNRPTKFTWSNFIPMLGDKYYGVGFEFQEALNYTNWVTMRHADNYESMPV